MSNYREAGIQFHNDLLRVKQEAQRRAGTEYEEGVQSGLEIALSIWRVSFNHLLEAEHEG